MKIAKKDDKRCIVQSTINKMDEDFESRKINFLTWLNNMHKEKTIKVSLKVTGIDQIDEAIETINKTIHQKHLNVLDYQHLVGIKTILDDIKKELIQNENK